MKLMNLHHSEFCYKVIKWLIDNVLCPNPPRPIGDLHRPKVGIIGTGLTGISAASYCVGYGYDIRIFDTGNREQLGGIWGRINNTSSLQMHSDLYNFYPSIRWNSSKPNRQQIISCVTELWKDYSLETKTFFETSVEKVYQDKGGRWIINDPSNGRFEGIIVAVGTCGDANIPSIHKRDSFKGKVYHSSNLKGKDFQGKTVLVIGGGASAVEVLDFIAHEEVEKIYILSRSDQWPIPRSAIVNLLASLTLFLSKVKLSWTSGTLLRKIFNQVIDDLFPKNQDTLTGTPMINSDIMNKLCLGQIEWLHGDIKEFSDNGVIFSPRKKSIYNAWLGQELEIKSDFVVMATGFDRPTLNFLPKDNFFHPYSPPNWYLQTFPPRNPTIGCINCANVNPIGMIGKWNIGVHTRILLMFISDPLTRPNLKWMLLWIDLSRFLRQFMPIIALDLVTYLELIWWFLSCIALTPSRWKWALFVFFGIQIGMLGKPH